MKPTTGEILEKAIAEDPDDLAAHSAYADWLSQEGDPRGEFIQVQLELEDFGRPFDERRQLLARESELFRAHGLDWLGGLDYFFLGEESNPAVLLDDGGPYRIKFFRGWLHEVHVPVLSLRFAEVFANSQSVRFLQRLIIDYLEISDDFYSTSYIEMSNDMGPAIEMLCDSPFLGNVRDFQLEHEQSSEAGDMIVPLIATMPRLEKLSFLASCNLAEFLSLPSLHHLRQLSIRDPYRYRNPQVAADFLSMIQTLSGRVTIERGVTWHLHFADDEIAKFVLSNLRARLHPQTMI